MTIRIGVFFFSKKPAECSNARGTTRNFKLGRSKNFPWEIVHWNLCDGQTLRIVLAKASLWL